MYAACPHCTGRVYVPEVYRDRLIKCPQCSGRFVPEHDGHRGAVTTLGAQEKLPPEPDPREFKGLETDHEVLVAMCGHAKVRGNAARIFGTAVVRPEERSLFSCTRGSRPGGCTRSDTQCTVALPGRGSAADERARERGSASMGGIRRGAPRAPLVGIVLAVSLLGALSARPTFAACWPRTLRSLSVPCWPA